MLVEQGGRLMADAPDFFDGPLRQEAVEAPGREWQSGLKAFPREAIFAMTLLGAKPTEKVKPSAYRGPV